jgi:hypothetical protein
LAYKGGWTALTSTTTSLERFKLPALYPVYPPHHEGPYLEEFFADYLASQTLSDTTTYIPVFWTAYHNNPKCGHPVPPGLQEDLDSLERKKRYFTVVQHSDGTGKLRLPPHTKIFSAGGWGYKGVPIPLVCSPHTVDNREKDIFCSFIGADTHPCRSSLEELNAYTTPQRRYLIQVRPWQASLNELDATMFHHALVSSIFTLCPRGYGPTSFRLYEAMQVGSIPVYIYDKPWLPYQQELDWRKLCVMIHTSRAKHLRQILEAITPDEIEAYRENIRQLQHRFTMAGVSQWILADCNRPSSRLQFLKNFAFSR